MKCPMWLKNLVFAVFLWSFSLHRRKFSKFRYCCFSKNVSGQWHGFDNISTLEEYFIDSFFSCLLSEIGDDCFVLMDAFPPEGSDVRPIRITAQYTDGKPDDWEHIEVVKSL